MRPSYAGNGQPTTNRSNWPQYSHQNTGYHPQPSHDDDPPAAQHYHRPAPPPEQYYNQGQQHTTTNNPRPTGGGGVANPSYYFNSQYPTTTTRSTYDYGIGNGRAAATNHNNNANLEMVPVANNNTNDYHRQDPSTAKKATTNSYIPTTIVPATYDNHKGILVLSSGHLRFKLLPTNEQNNMYYGNFYRPWPHEGDLSKYTNMGKWSWDQEIDRICWEDDGMPTRPGRQRKPSTKPVLGIQTTSGMPNNSNPATKKMVIMFEFRSITDMMATKKDIQFRLDAAAAAAKKKKNESENNIIGGGTTAAANQYNNGTAATAATTRGLLPNQATTTSTTKTKPPQFHVIKTTTASRDTIGNTWGQTISNDTPITMACNSSEQELSQQVQQQSQVISEQSNVISQQGHAISQLQKEFRNLSARNTTLENGLMEQRRDIRNLRVGIFRYVVESMQEYLSWQSNKEVVANTPYGDMDPGLVNGKEEWQDEVLGLIDGNVQKIDEEDLHVPFGESAYTLLFMYGVKTQAFWYALLVVALQAVAIILTLAEAVDIHSKANPLQIPPMVDLPVTIIQATALFVLLPYVTDLIDSVVKLQDGSYHQEVQQGYQYLDRNGYHQQSAHPSASYCSWLISCLVQLFVGFLVVVGCFILTMQADSAVDVMLNLTALLFLTEMDDLGFKMANNGFISKQLQEDTETVMDYKLPKRHPRYAVRRVLYLLTLSSLFICYGFVKNQQLDGAFLPTYIYVQFGDAYNHKIGYYSGIYKADSMRNRGYRTYEDMITGNIVVLSYCDAEKVQAFSDTSDPCDYFAKSPETTSYDVSSISSSEWLVIERSTNLTLPFDSFRLVNQDCKEETCKGNNGTCIEGLCGCPPDRFGINCEFSDVCAELVISEQVSPFPDWKPKINSSRYLSEEVSVSDAFHMLRNETNDAPVKAYNMPVYYSSKNYPASIIFFGGYRWILTSEHEMLGEKFLSEQPQLGQQGFTPYYTNETARLLGDRFHGYYQANYAPYFYSEPMGFQTPDFKSSPIGLSWWTVKLDDMNDSNQRNTTERMHLPDSQVPAQLACKPPRCMGADNVCGDAGFCNEATGVCTCYDGYFGSRCNLQGKCDQCKENEVCDSFSGECRCKTPTHGSNCDINYLCFEEHGQCRNGGICNNTTGICDCPSDDPAISGVACEMLATCQAYGCQNGGICGYDGRCICPPPFHGTHCSGISITDFDVTQKEEFMCTKDGDCQSMDRNATCDLGSGLCTCKEAYGARCEHKYNCSLVEDINLKLSWVHLDNFGVSCLNKGKCNHLSGLCDCPGNYTGPDCSIPPVKCMSDDNCITGIWASGKCDTQSGHCLADGGKLFPRAFDILTGEMKELKLCPSFLPVDGDESCYNGGRCQIDRAACTCPHGSSGSHCEYITVGDYSASVGQFLALEGQTFLRDCSGSHCEYITVGDYSSSIGVQSLTLEGETFLRDWTETLYKDCSYGQNCFLEGWEANFVAATPGTISGHLTGAEARQKCARTPGIKCCVGGPRGGAFFEACEWTNKVNVVLSDDSCIGAQACLPSTKMNVDFTGPFTVGPGSCHGPESCLFKGYDSVSIGKYSCRGGGGVCNVDATGVSGLVAEVGDRSCVGIEGCDFFELSDGSKPEPGNLQFGDYSCRGWDACNERPHVKDPVGDGSCIGRNSCQGAAGEIGNGSCSGSQSCYGAKDEIGDGSCIGGSACQYTYYEIGDGSCIGSDACYGGGFGEIGNGSCIGSDACQYASGKTGDRSCIGDYACFEASELHWSSFLRSGSWGNWR